MKKHAFAILFIFSLIFFSLGCSRELAVKSVALGSNLSPDGTISEESLVYTFKKPADAKTGRDLFDHIYFEGDTVCFSFSLTCSVSEKDVEVFFIEPASKKAYRAERIDVIDRTVSGFSLTGSLLEQFYRDDRSRPLPEKAFCCRPVPFTVRLVIHGPDGDTTGEKSGAFEIRYENL